MVDDRNIKPEDLRETDLAQEKMGRNKLQGSDQANVRNERQDMPGGKREPDQDIEESFRKMDKDVRARTDLNKGATRGKP